MDYTATKVDPINMDEMVWYEGMLMTRREAHEMKANNK